MDLTDLAFGRYPDHPRELVESANESELKTDSLKGVVETVVVAASRSTQGWAWISQAYCLFTCIFTCTYTPW